MSKLTAPKAKKVPFKIEQLGYGRTDDYHWMKDDRWQEVLRDPDIIKTDVKDHLTLENAYSKDMLKPTEALQATLFEEMKGRIKEDDSSVPAADGAWEYYVRYNAGAQHPINARKPRSKDKISKEIIPFAAVPADEQILLDEDAAAKGLDYYATGTTTHSPDHKLYAWSEDTQGSEVYKIHVKDLATGERLGKPVESATGDFVFSPDSQYLFWTFRDDNGRPSKIYRRPAKGGEDVLIYDEKDPGFFIGVGSLSSDKFIIISIGNQETSEVWLIPASDPTKAPVCVEPRVTGVMYEVDHWDDRFVILTNADDALDFKLMTSTATMPSKSTWQPWVAHRPGTYITGFSLYKGHLVRVERENANSRIIVTKKADLSDHEIGVKEEAYALGLGGSLEYDTTVMRYTYTSPTTPSQTYDYDMDSRQKTLRKTQVIPSGHNPNDYVAKRLYAKAPDGVDVPVTVLMKKDVKLDGKAPLLLYGYGSYGIPMEPAFSIRNLSLVNRGWIYATAHIRGGSEKGRGWFMDGRKFKKKNTFTDFIACAEHLTAKGYGSKGRIVAYGGSAGGMLMGAITNMRPDLWAGVIGAVPFVDVLNTMSDTSLPLTPPEWPEWGNPIEDKAAYDYIASYSPYDNIAAKAYPPVLATGGLSDPRVTYWEPMKWISKLREFNTSQAPMLLKINMEAGHGGASGRFDFLKEIAFDYAFAIWAVDKGYLKA
ncbi:prolyl oligopeptidase [Asticcacaulis endophyticus]|uniref:Prolyl oligopeptidase n=2 Tax=Asticcacaulis endophyticus TaxID=1395890 RepID=A0A918UVM1_9CAUL|nr:S9 family peptidase [Asticcacaulis endophyticus]GGZ37406.1 prolyl oligopeptidase [Asticcacaulis endophyticus]